MTKSKHLNLTQSKIKGILYPKMRIKNIEIHNYKSLEDVKLKDIGDFSVFLGENGAGKTAFFDVFRFIRECVRTGSIKRPLHERNGFDDLITRNAKERKISIKITVACDNPAKTLTYTLILEQLENNAVVSNEILNETITQAKGKLSNTRIINYKFGKGFVQDPDKEFSPISTDAIALGIYGEIGRYRLIKEFKDYILGWYFADFFVNTMRRESQPMASTSILSEDCENLREVIEALSKNHPDKLAAISDELSIAVNGIDTVSVERDESNKLHLRISNKSFKIPFSEKSISDGTLKYLAYLTLINQPTPITLLIVEEPENQIYIRALRILFELFESNAASGQQTMLSSHSPEFVGTAKPKDVYLVKKNAQTNYTNLQKVVKNAQLLKYIESMGFVEAWRDGGLFGI